MRLFLSIQYHHHCRNMYHLSPRLRDLFRDFVQSMFKLSIQPTRTFQWPLPSDVLQDAILRLCERKLSVVR